MRYLAVLNNTKKKLNDLIELIYSNSKILNYINKSKKLTILNLNNFLKKEKINLNIFNLTGKQLKYHLENNLKEFP